jgi:hypothetical protein
MMHIQTNYWDQMKKACQRRASKSDIKKRDRKTSGLGKTMKNEALETKREHKKPELQLIMHLRS